MPTQNIKRTVFVCWSAGLDSTYLILRLLEDGYDVSAAYIDILNNHTKARMEKDAIAKMCAQIKSLFPHFNYLGILYKAKNSSPARHNVKYKQVPYFINALLVAPRTDYRCIAYVKGDSVIKNLSTIKSIYNQYAGICNGELPKLTFPLRHATKVEIFTYMSECYADILSNCVWCEAPRGDEFIPCNTCTPCVRRQSELVSMQQSFKEAG